MQKLHIIMIIMKNESCYESQVQINGAARKIWEYMILHQHLEKADVILVLGCSDEYVAKCGADLYLDGYGEFLLISGGVGPKNNSLATVWPEATEAEHFAKIILSRGVPEDKVLIENASTNTGENIAYSYQLLQSKNIAIQSLIAIHKRHMERRVFATLKQQ